MATQMSVSRMNVREFLSLVWQRPRSVEHILEVLRRLALHEIRVPAAEQEIVDAFGLRLQAV